MSERNKDAIVNIYETEPKEVVDNEKNVTVCFITVELEDEDGGVVDVREHKELDLILQRLFGREHISAMYSTKACHRTSREASFFYILINGPLELDKVHQKHGGNAITANDHKIV